MTVQSTSLSSIQEMDRSDLLLEWQKRFGHPAPKHVSQKLLISVLCWETQAEQEGGLSPQAVRYLKDRARQLGAVQPKVEAGTAGSVGIGKRAPKARAGMLRPGIQLMREWNGRTYRVEVTETGFRMDGKPYKSLTAIARRITGAHWSGPRFFGLADRRAS